MRCDKRPGGNFAPHSSAAGLTAWTDFPELLLHFKIFETTNLAVKPECPGFVEKQMLWQSL
jgi:hypothetical protein